ncbi:MAG: hypothetical protein R2797_02765 [Gelidibacter sp.]
MKLLLLLFSLASSTVQMFAQTNVEKVAGTYEIKFEATNGLIIETLTLNSDGTYVFHAYERIDQRLSLEGNKYGKGRWMLNTKTITFVTSKEDLDDKHSLDFTNSKARFIIKSPRDTSDRMVKTALQFYESKTDWLTGRTYIKTK